MTENNKRLIAPTAELERRLEENAKERLRLRRMLRLSQELDEQEKREEVENG